MLSHDYELVPWARCVPQARDREHSLARQHRRPKSVHNSAVHLGIHMVWTTVGVSVHGNTMPDGTDVPFP